MSTNSNWTESMSFFNYLLDELKESRGIEEDSLVFEKSDSVGICIGERVHIPDSSPKWVDRIEKNIAPSCGLYVANSQSRKNGISDKSYDYMFSVDAGKVQITYLAVTSSNKNIQVKIDLSKTEALKFASALNKAVSNIIDSENDFELR